MVSTIIRLDALRSVAYSDITSSYTPIGPVLAHQMRLLHFQNNTDATMLVSFDGVTDNLKFPPNFYQLFDGTTNREQNATFFVFQTGTQLYVKYLTMPTTGSFDVEGLYAQGQ